MPHIGKDDLRYKLLQKGAFRRAQSDNKKCLDLREKLPKADQAPIRHRNPPLHNTNILRRTPTTRSADDLPQKDSLGSSYSPWTMDNLRQRSPARIVESSRHYSLQRDDEKLQRRPANLSFENARSVGYVAKDVHNASGSVSTATYVTNSLLPPTSAKPVAPVVPLHPPPSGIAHKTLYPVWFTFILLTIIKILWLFGFVFSVTWFFRTWFEVASAYFYWHWVVLYIVTTLVVVCHCRLFIL